MHKKQLILACIIVALVIILFGLETTHTDYQDPARISIDLSLYDQYIGSDLPNPPYPSLGKLAYLGNYKYGLIIATLLIGSLLINILKQGQL